MENAYIKEKELHPKSGAAALVLLILGEIAALAMFVVGTVMTSSPKSPAAVTAVGIVMLVVGVMLIIVFSILFGGLRIVHPNEARVLTLFGKYYGTIKESGFYYINPFSVSFSPAYNAARNASVVKALSGAATVKDGTPNESYYANASKSISLKTQTLNNRNQKVNDVLGNPIIIGAVVIWRVADPTTAAFSVENYIDFLSIQADSTVRNIARLYPYDVFDDDEDNDGIKERTLRGSSVEIAESMKSELQKRVSVAGLEIEEVRITHLAYAEEIAAAMLQRQQAVAIIAARQKIVDGAVGMVKMAIDKLGEDEIVTLDEERKAAMVSNLLVVLCGNKDAQPIVNSGSIY